MPAVPASLPAPIGGWNARDALGQMDPTDAVFMTNWFPGTSDVQLRNGYTQHSTGLGAQVETLAVYAGATTNKLFAAAGTSVYDATSSGAIGAAVLTSTGNARFQYVNVSTSGGNFLLMVNGSVKLKGYNGTAWWTDGDGTHDITGLDTSTVNAITLFKNRVWLLSKSSLSAYYLATSSIAGAATEFPLKGVAREGGYLIAMGTWTIDAGYGVDDLAVFVTSKGEVIVYRGTDPANASTWALVGIWKLGSPIGARCLQKYGGDLVLICQDGLVPLSAGLQSSRLDPRVSLTNKIQWAVSSAVQSYSATFGWDITYYPKANMLLLNVPVSVGSQQQYVMNSITKAWCNFTGWAANCFTVYNDDLYFGGNGVVCKAWDGNADNSTDIAADAQQAFNYFGAPGQLKRFTMLRPVLRTNGSPAILAGINIDFDDTAPSGSLSYTGQTAAVWDTATWDVGTWGGGLSIQKQWQGCNGVGYSAAVRMKTTCHGIEVHWVATDVVMERGGIL